MKSIYYEENGLSYELDQIKLTAKVINSPRARGEIFIPRSIIYQSREYIITRIDERSFKNNCQIYSVSFSIDSEVQSIGNKAFDSSTIEILHFPSKIELLENGWCINTKSLNHIIISSENKNFKYLDNDKKIIIGKSKNGE